METTKGHVRTIDEYINTCPEAVRSTLRQLRAAIKEAAPEANETIKYNMPAFVFHGNLVYFAAYKHHIAMYPTTAGMEGVIQDLATYRRAKDSLHFALDQPLPLELIREVVRFRVYENLARKQAFGR